VINEKFEKKSILQKELNTKEVLLVLGIVTLIVIYGAVFIYPRYAEYKAYATILEQIENQISTYKGRINELPQLESKLNNLTKEIEVKSKILSYNMEDGMFLIGLSKLMDAVNVDLVEYYVEESKSYHAFYAIPTTIKVRGNYKNVREVMNYLEQQNNITQILDYNMETYIDEEESDTANVSSLNSSVTTNDLSYSDIGWTLNSNLYHNKDCSILEEEAQQFGGSFIQAAPPNNYKACSDCKPILSTKTSQGNIVQESSIDNNEVPKAKGDIIAKFSFIMYSSENPKIELDNDDFTTWNPGKWNPFTTTR
jgi:Tfp pilus assembly protein PilO